jgi:hypothetical protein
MRCGSPSQAGALIRLHSMILLPPVITSPLSSTRIGTPLCPLSLLILARSLARDGQVHGVAMPPST